MTLAIILFVLTYVGLLTLPKYRAYVAIGSAAVFIILNILPLGNVFSSVDWNVLMMIAGTMGIVALFIESKMPSLLADLIIEKMPNVKWAIVSLALFAGVVSAFVDNVATVLMVAPVALNIAKKLKISPVPSIICIAISSNLQGAATLVGDTTSILLAGELDMSFIDFFWFHGKPGIFFVVEAGAIVSIFVLLWIFRKDKAPLEKSERTVVTDYFPSVLLTLMILFLIGASFIPNNIKPNETNGYICLGLLVIGLGVKLIKTKRLTSIVETIKEVDFFTLLLLGGLFLVIAGIKEAGVIDEIARIIQSLGGGNIFVIYTIIIFASVVLSAFIDNIPYVMTMLPVVASLGAAFGDKAYVLYFGLLIGATLGGNLTPIGASANIAGIGILRKEGYEVKATTFMKYGIPFTLAAVLTGYVLLWVIWGI